MKPVLILLAILGSITWFFFKDGPIDDYYANPDNYRIQQSEGKYRVQRRSWSHPFHDWSNISTDYTLEGARESMAWSMKFFSNSVHSKTQTWETVK